MRSVTKTVQRRRCTYTLVRSTRTLVHALTLAWKRLLGSHRAAPCPDDESRKRSREESARGEESGERCTVVMSLRRYVPDSFNESRGRSTSAATAAGNLRDFESRRRVSLPSKFPLFNLRRFHRVCSPLPRAVYYFTRSLSLSLFARRLRRRLINVLFFLLHVHAPRWADIPCQPRILSIAV